MTLAGGGVIGGQVPSAQDEFLELKDTPSSFSGEALEFLRVNAGEDAIEYFDLFGTANTFTAAQKINVSSANALFVENDGVRDNVLVVDTSAGRVGINRVPTTVIYPGMEIQGDGNSFAMIGKAGFSNYSGIGLGNGLTTTTYNILGGSADSNLYINTKTGGIISFRINNNQIAALGSTLGLGVSQDIYHLGDADTLIRFTDDEIAFSGGGIDLLRLKESTQDIVVVNEGGTDVDFRVESISDTHLIFTQGNTNRVGISNASPVELFDVDGLARAQTFTADGDVGSGADSTIRFTGATDTPTTDPGWASSSTVDMNAPDGYVKLYVGTQAVVVPYWNT